MGCSPRSLGARAHSGAPHGHALTWKPAERESLWNLRKKGVGLLGNAPGARKPVPFVEDTVVPPEHLQAYVREFRALLDAEGLRYGMFGHVDVGCLHVRPALDLKDPEDEARVRRITDAVTDARDALRRACSGASTARAFAPSSCPTTSARCSTRSCSASRPLFDPRNQLNPGKIATPAGTSYVLARVDGPTRGALDRQIAVADREALGTVIHCNGNGQCFDTSTDSIMCPSSKITRDRIHSPKGRATLDARVAAPAREQRGGGDAGAACIRRLALDRAPLAAIRAHRVARATSPIRCTTRCRAAWPARPARRSAPCASTCPTFARSSSSSTTAATPARSATTSRRCSSGCCRCMAVGAAPRERADGQRRSAAG